MIELGIEDASARSRIYICVVLRLRKGITVSTWWYCPYCTSSVTTTSSTSAEPSVFRLRLRLGRVLYRHTGLLHFSIRELIAIFLSPSQLPASLYKYT